MEYSGEDDFDQINVLAQPGDTNNQNGRFEFTDGRSGGTGLAVANAAMGLFTNYGEIGTRSRTDWRALAIDAFIQDSWRARDNLTIEGGVRYAYWPPWYAKLNNIAMFHPDFYDPAVAAVIDPATGAIIGGDRFNGIVLPADGFPPEASGVVPAADDPQYQRLFHGLPRGFSETHALVFQPRLGVAWQINPKTVLRLGGGVYHTRVTLNDSTLLGGNPPIQFKVGVTNGLADEPTGGTRRDFPLVMTMQDPVFKHPTAYNWSVSFQRQLPWDVVADLSYVGRIGTHLQRERNLNQMEPGTIQANPGVNPNALRPYKGFGTIRLSENAGRSEYHGMQVNLERRFRGGLGFGVAYTLSRLRDNGDEKRDILFNAYDDSGYWGAVRQPPHPRLQCPLRLRAALLAHAGHAPQEDPGRLADLRSDLLPVRPAASRLAHRRRGGRGRHDRPALEPRRGPEGLEPAVLAGATCRSELLVQPAGLRPARRRAPSATPAGTR